MENCGMCCGTPNTLSTKLITHARLRAFFACQMWLCVGVWHM